MQDQTLLGLFPYADIEIELKIDDAAEFGI